MRKFHDANQKIKKSSHNSDCNRFWWKCNAKVKFQCDALESREIARNEY